MHDDRFALTRRQFLAASGAVAAGTLTSTLAAKPAEVRSADDSSGDFSFLALGDTHFDRLEHHDMKWLEDGHQGDISQVKHYSEHAATLLPQLLKTVVQQRQDSTPTVDCLVHVGDFVEGLCGRPDLATRHCREAIEFFEQAQVGVPLMLTKGNHDITGPGATEAYRDEMLPFLGHQVNDRVKSPNYAVRRRDCLFVMFDGYDKTSLDWLKHTIKGERPRRLFFITHQPIVPFQARSSWCPMIKPSQTAERTQLLNLLGEHGAVVIVGHVHRYGAVVRQTEQGPFVQMCVSSILSGAQQSPKQERSGVDAYNGDLVELEPSFSATTKAERRGILEAERPFIRHFEYAEVAGHLRFRVSGDALDVDVYNGTSATPWRTLSLDKLLQA